MYILASKTLWKAALRVVLRQLSELFAPTWSSNVDLIGAATQNEWGWQLWSVHDQAEQCQSGGADMTRKGSRSTTMQVSTDLQVAMTQIPAVNRLRQTNSSQGACRYLSAQRAHPPFISISTKKTECQVQSSVGLAAARALIPLPQ